MRALLFEWHLSADVEVRRTSGGVRRTRGGMRSSDIILIAVTLLLILFIEARIQPSRVSFTFEFFEDLIELLIV